MRLEEKWPTWTLTVHKVWRQMIPSKNYTPETKYNTPSLERKYSERASVRGRERWAFAEYICGTDSWSGRDWCEAGGGGGGMKRFRFTSCFECVLKVRSELDSLFFLRQGIVRRWQEPFRVILVFHAFIFGKPWWSPNRSETCKLVLTSSCKLMWAFAATNFPTTSTWPLLDA